MNKEEPWFFTQRAEAFAKLVLSKHNAVRFFADSDLAVDLLVEIRAKGHWTPRRIFGVQLVNFMDLPTLQDEKEQMLAQCEPKVLADDLPLCVFVIGVRKPEGIYRWLVAPVIEDGQALLQRQTALPWHILDEDGATRLIDQVNSWYDALKENSPPKTRQRHPKMES